jgi:hypothetical protein
MPSLEPQPSDWAQRPISTFREWLMAEARGEGVDAAS